jgi:hypothetical protein
MDCVTSETDHSSSSNESAIISTKEIISMNERSSFYLTTPIRRLVNSSTDQYMPNNRIVSVPYENNSTSTIDEYEHLEYSNDKENNIDDSCSTTQNSTEVKKTSNT